MNTDAKGRGEKSEGRPGGGAWSVFAGWDVPEIAWPVFCRRFPDGLDESQGEIGDFFDARWSPFE